MLQQTNDLPSVEDLEWRATAAARYAALKVAIEHWTVDGGDLAGHVDVAIRGFWRS